MTDRADEFDYVIVGAGTAGCLLANRLSADPGARVLLLGVRLPENYGAYGREFDALYPRLAEELDVAFVPAFMEGVGLVPELNLRDGLHPNPAGHERLADNVAPALAALLEELAAR